MQFTVGEGLPTCQSGSFQEHKLQFANSEILLMIENKCLSALPSLFPFTLLLISGLSILLAFVFM